MQVSIVGDQPAAVSFVRELLSSDDVRNVSGYIHGPLNDALRDVQLSVRRVNNADSACAGEEFDAVVIAESTADESVRLARLAVQSGRDVWIFEPDDVSPAWAFELQLLLDETSAAIVPLCGRLRRLSSLRANKSQLPPTSEIRQIQVDLTVCQPVNINLARTQREALDLVATLGPVYTSVIAVDQHLPDGRLLQRTLTLGASTESGLAVPPSVIVLRTEDDPRDLLVIRTVRDEAIEETVGPPDNILPMLKALTQDRPRVTSWMTSCAASLELEFAAQRSLKKRRAIDVHHDSGSERSVFKSQMTAIGCVILMLMMMGLVAFLVVATVLDPPPAVLKWLRALWIAPAVLYLLAQLLLPVARNRSPRREDEEN